jgi:hypothetical protein
MAEIIVKKGETILQCEVKRFSRGLVVTAKAHPSVEAYFQEGANGTPPLAVGNYGRNWSIMPGFPDLTILSVGPEFGRPILMPNGEDYYVISQPGQLMLTDPNGTGRNNTINISFLRCEGISRDLGVSFSIKGLYTEKQVREIAQRINEATKRFYVDFMRPIGVVITLTTQEASFV